MALWTTGKIQITAYNPVVVEAIAAASTERAGEKVVGYIRSELTRADRNDTGTLADSFVAETTITALGPLTEVFSTLPPLEPTGRTLADIIDQGSGVYGPYGSPIVSPYGKIMRFNPSRKSSVTGRRGVTRGKGGRFQSAYVYAYTVLGQPGVRFIENAEARLTLADFLIL